MAPNRVRSPALPRSTRSRPLRPQPDCRPYQRSPLLASADDRSLPRLAPCQITLPRPAFAPLSRPRVDGENRASGNASASVPYGVNCAGRLGSFFSKRIRDFSQFLGYVEPVDDRFTVLQALSASGQERCPHVRMMELYRLALFRRQYLQAGFAGGFVATCGHRQDLRLRRVRQVRQNRRIAFMAFPQTDLVHPYAFDLALRIDLVALGILDAVLHDTIHRLDRDAQLLGHILARAGNQADQDVLLETIGVFHITPLEWWNQRLPMLATRTTMHRLLIREKTRLSPDVQISDRKKLVLLDQVQRRFPLAGLTTAGDR